MKKILLMLVVLAVFAALAFGCGSGESGADKTQGDSGQAATEEVTEAATEETTEISQDAGTTASPEEKTGDKSTSVPDYTAVIDVKDYGKITLSLDGSVAPITVENFVALAKDGFYDGLTFHRIMDGFMIQGGDPLGNGTGGSDKTIKGEFSENGVNNPISHVRGTVSMARSQDPDSASSQFFIVQADSTFLDGQYAAFGSVTEGMDIVDKICEAAVPLDDNGTIPADEQPVINSITITE